MTADSRAPTAPSSSLVAKGRPSRSARCCLALYSCRTPARQRQRGVPPLGRSVRVGAFGSALFSSMTAEHPLDSAPKERMA